jgi:hypothetical protein
VIWTGETSTIVRMLTSMLQATGLDTKRNADRNGRLEVQNTAEHFATFSKVEKQHINKTKKYISQDISLEKGKHLVLEKRGRSKFCDSRWRKLHTQCDP